MSMINLDSPFLSYTLTEEERLQGSYLQEGQRQVIQNNLFMAACEKMNLPWTPDNLQAEAELQGKIRCLQSILDDHKEAESYFASKQNTYINEDMSNLRQDYRDIFQTPDIPDPQA